MRCSRIHLHSARDRFALSADSKAASRSDYNKVIDEYSTPKEGTQPLSFPAQYATNIMGQYKWLTWRCAPRCAAQHVPVAPLLLPSCRAMCSLASAAQCLPAALPPLPSCRPA